MFMIGTLLSSAAFQCSCLTLFRRHCECVYYQDWHRTKRPKQAAILPGVSRAVASDQNASAGQSPRNTLSSNTGVIIAVNEESVPPSLLQNIPAPPSQPSAALPFNEEAKLVYGVILSLRNMIRKLSGRYPSFLLF